MGEVLAQGGCCESGGQREQEAETRQGGMAVVRELAARPGPPRHRGVTPPHAPGAGARDPVHLSARAPHDPANAHLRA